jgi:hypothetical protein
MQITAPELVIINIAANTFPLGKTDRPLVREIISLIFTLTEGEKMEKHFVDGEIELSTLHKAFLLKATEALSWTNSQWDVVDSLKAKIV